MRMIFNKRYVSEQAKKQMIHLSRYRIYGNQQFIYSWKPVLTNKPPAGKNITEGKT